MGVRQGPLEDLEVSVQFWQNKKVFLTGHTGFKGSWLSLWLQSLGAKVTGYALSPPTHPNLFEVARVEEGMRSIIGDVRDIENLKRAMKEANPEIVIHMAAQPLVRYSYLNPIETYATNVMGVVNMLEACRENSNLKAILNVTSDKCYENKEIDRGYREDEPMGGFDPYSNSKGCSELVTASYRSSFFNPQNYEKHSVGLASARAGNVIGGGDWALDRLIPDMVHAFMHHKAVVMRNPKAIRPWQHVLEPLRGYLDLTQKLYEEGPSFAEAWNFGPNNEDVKPVEWIVKTMAERWGEDARWTIDQGENPHEASFLRLDITKASHDLNWQPRMNLSDALDQIIHWYKAYINKADMHQITCDQIKQYREQTSLRKI